MKARGIGGFLEKLHNAAALSRGSLVLFVRTWYKEISASLVGKGVSFGGYPYNFPGR
jgi:hypothetical protein